MDETDGLEGGEKDRRIGHGESSAKAKLEGDVERLERHLAVIYFLIVVLLLVLFDGYVFTFYKTWGAPVCLTAIEMAGLFVLARRLEVDELVHLALEIVRNWRGSENKDSDPD